MRERKAAGRCEEGVSISTTGSLGQGSSSASSPAPMAGLASLAALATHHEQTRRSACDEPRARHGRNRREPLFEVHLVVVVPLPCLVAENGDDEVDGYTIRWWRPSTLAYRVRPSHVLVLCHPTRLIAHRTYRARLASTLHTTPLRISRHTPHQRDVDNERRASARVAERDSRAADGCAGRARSAQGYH